jgi:glutamate--cysteine ligase
MTDPVLREAGMTFVATAVGALTRAGQPELAAAVAAFGERYPARRRCPADDRATGRDAGRATDPATDRATAPEESA